MALKAKRKRVEARRLRNTKFQADLARPAEDRTAQFGKANADHTLKTHRPYLPSINLLSEQCHAQMETG